ncbi:MAG: protoheme IX farnesyltransferase [Nitriliruptorales bacterium]|nr:protoheme IX farnesyltransferase [Nitriliruptorales bacterium]
MSVEVAPPSVRETVRAYVGLTKPRIIELLLVTTLPTMVVAQRGIPDLWLVMATLIGGTLAAGGANTINSWADRDIDEQMHRTSHRPLPRHAVSPANALRFGILLGALAFVWLALAVNLLSALLATAALLFYVFVYTLGLKRRTVQNIVIGGAAGCVPVLVGWSAVTGEVGLPALVLFAIVFAWTPPHFWALAMKYSDDYARAGVPMLPVVAGPKETARQILLYTILLVSVTLLFGPVGGMGPLYLMAALVLGGIFICYAVRLLRHQTERLAMRTFRYSITYLGLLFTAMAADAIIIG